ncbi:uncharacterized protein PHACADRAFT_156516 [Phanerochaete carnosa HHB-10118-sp]|uniref:Uncharacterized protein n=1 Tax=Phanerochaete carnosa (strain HHB-10118-sp) TaxID=650164 RepID=K5VE84_PHACS|nr:uncharacterized protein PHACADRAFT_156516 [Phanerochaete carnosa HHB-10118-sp]EKM61286.1 hypothetical protein PHACADRAFT_156516 [Phanerochaete carnosa HHB-10118-sp]
MAKTNTRNRIKDEKDERSGLSLAHFVPRPTCLTISSFLMMRAAIILILAAFLGAAQAHVLGRQSGGCNCAG